MKIGVARESAPLEARVALTPAAVEALSKKRHQVVVEAGAGVGAGIGDEAFAAAGASVVPSRAALFAAAEALVMVRTAGANPAFAAQDLELFRAGQVVIGLLDPLGNPQALPLLAARGVRSFALELLPRITRAQPMDALSSMANLAGYKAVLLGANELPRAFPMMITAAGTLTPAKVLVVGAGVAGLSAIATAKRLGAVVEAYDIRPEVRDQVKSVGGKFVDLGLETTAAAEASGYARQQSEEFIAEQQRRLAQHVRSADVLITTAAVPGRRAPILITAAMQQGMRPGSVIVDLAAESGGNCESTRPGERITVEGVTVIGPLNLPATLAQHASLLYAKNISSFVLHLSAEDGRIGSDPEDEITRATLVTREGEIVNARVRAALEHATG